MELSKETQGSKTNHFLDTVKLGLIWGFIFAIVDTLYSTLKNYSWYRAEGTGIGLKTEFYALAFYVPSVLAILLLLSILLVVARKFRPAWLSEYHDEILSGALASLLVFILLESFASPGHVWRMFLQAAAFGAAAMFAGAGAFTMISRLRSSRADQSLYRILSFIAAGAFTFNHLSLALLTSINIHNYLLIAAVIFLVFASAIFFWIGWRFILSESKSLKYIWIVICILFILSPVANIELNPGTEKKSALALENPINIIVIVSDSLRTDAVGLYGGTNSTPNIDRMGREGVIFKNAVCQAPWTLPSMLSAISSRYPSVVQRGRLYQAPATIVTLTEVLNSRGYFTKLLMGNFNMGKASGFVQGFEEFEVFNQFYRLQRLLPLPILLKLHYLYLRSFNLPLFPDLTDTITRKTVRFLDSKSPPEPFFLLLHYMDPHEPYDPPRRYIGRRFNTQLRKPFSPNNPWHIRGDYSDPQGEDIRIGMLHLTSEDKEFLHYLYEMEVQYLDERIGELIEKLKETGLDRNTLVIFTSDHGEEFWDHGDWGHGQSLYNELIHVPLIIWGAGIPPKEIGTPVELIDLAPALLELLGLPIPEGFQGRSFMPLIRGEPAGARPVFSEATRHFEEMKSIQDETHKLVWRQETKRYELYDIVQDEAETMNIYSPDHPAFKRLERELWQWADQNLKLQKDVSGRDPLPAHEEEIKRRLKALGYIK